MNKFKQDQPLTPELKRLKERYNIKAYPRDPVDVVRDVCKNRQVKSKNTQEFSWKDFWFKFKHPIFTRRFKRDALDPFSEKYREAVKKLLKK